MGLPPESNTMVAIRGDDMAWSTSDHILACVIDAINANTYVYAQSVSDKRKLPRPEPFPRPGAKPVKKASQFALMARQARAKAMNRE